MSEMLEDALSEAGFLPEVLSSAEDAVTLLQGEVASFWAVVTDVNLRGAMTDLPRVAREREPSLPLRLHDREGCGGPGQVRRAQEHPSHEPFAPAQLVTAVAQLLNGGGPPA